MWQDERSNENSSAVNIYKSVYGYRHVILIVDVALIYPRPRSAKKLLNGLDCIEKKDTKAAINFL